MIELVKFHKIGYTRYFYSIRIVKNYYSPFRQFSLYSQVKLIPSRKRRISKDTLVGASLSDNQRIPRELDWREIGFKTQPENQRDCGSCYAYSIAGSIEGQIFKKTGMLLPLSEQQLVDCSTSTGNLGCSGGSLRNTLRYLEKAKGLMAKTYYPYKAKVRIFLLFSLSLFLIFYLYLFFIYIIYIIFFFLFFFIYIM